MQFINMKFDITEDMLAMLQEYITTAVDYLHAGMSIGRWILMAGAVLAVIALLSRSKWLQTFFRKKRVR